MTANLRYMTTNLVDDATLSATPALVVGLAEDNLIDAERSNVARTSSTAAQAIKGDFAANQTIDCALMWSHNLTDSATWRVRLFSAVAQGGSTLYDSTATAPHGAGIFDDWPARRRFAVDYFTQVTTVRSFQLDLADASNGDGFMQLGEFWLGEYTEMANQILHGWQMSLDDGAQVKTTLGGSRYTIGGYSGGANRELSADLYLNDVTDRAAWAALLRKVGSSSPVWIDPFPDASDEQQHVDHAMLALIDGRQAIRNRTRDFYRAALKAQEV